MKKQQEITKTRIKQQQNNNKRVNNRISHIWNRLLNKTFMTRNWQGSGGDLTKRVADFQLPWPDHFRASRPL